MIHDDDSLFEYAMGGGLWGGGLASIAGDAGGFSCCGPLSIDEVRGNIECYLEFEVLEFGADREVAARLIEQAVNDGVFDDIHKAHVRAFVEHCANKAGKDLTNWHEAVLAGDHAALLSLARDKAQAGKINNTCGACSPVHIAAIVGSADAIRILVDAGADPTLRIRSDWSSQVRDTTPLALAAAHGRPEALRALLPCSEIDAVDFEGRTALARAISNKIGCSCAQILLSAGADPSLGDARFGHDALMRAARHGRADLISVLLPLCDATRVDATGRNAADVAAAAGQPDIAGHIRSFREARDIAAATGQLGQPARRAARSL